MKKAHPMELYELRVAADVRDHQEGSVSHDD
jgi:hypothetical protein